jgi:molybdate transport system substrate-binding protein
MMTALAVLLGIVLALPTAADTLLVGAASSLREVVDALARRFEAVHADNRVQVSYGASSVLAAQVRAGAPLDVLLLADARLADELAKTLEVPSATPFANNRLVVVARDAEVEIESPEALRDEGIRRIAIPSPAVPVGRYAREWLARNDLLDVLDARAVQTEHARATLMAVDHGHADVAIVYETDARLARNAVVAYRIADADQSVIEYVALLCPEAAASPLAERWLHFMAEPEAREALEAAGFGTPSLRGLP